MPSHKPHILSLLLLLFSFSLKAQTVYKTPSGAKYHLATCHMVKNVSEAITLAKAKELGLEPCKICKPEISYSSASQSKTAQGQKITVQCKGLTPLAQVFPHNHKIITQSLWDHLLPLQFHRSATGFTKTYHFYINLKTFLPTSHTNSPLKLYIYILSN